jgi:hypothetical protein
MNPLWGISDDCVRVCVCAFELLFVCVCVFVYFVVLFVGSVFREEAVGYCILGRYLLVYNLYFISSEGWKYKSIPQISCRT